MHSKKRNENGIAHLLAIVLIVGVVGVIGFAGWRVSSKNKTTSNQTTNNSVVVDKALEDSCNKEIKDKTFCKFAASYNYDKLASKTVITSSGKENSISTLEADGKKNYSMTVEQNGKVISAFISLDNTSYIKDPASGTWTKYSSTSEDSKSGDVSAELKLETEDFTKENLSYKSHPKEKCGNFNCFKYEVVDTTKPGAQQFIWFDDKEYQVRRVMIKDGTDTMDMVVTYQSVTIQPPTPVKDGNAEIDAARQAAEAAAAAY